MIKVKKAWRKVEEEILTACQNLPKNVTLCRNTFGLAVNNMGIRIPNGYNKVCPLGARLLGTNDKDELHVSLGVPRNWMTGFWEAVDDYSQSPFASNDSKAGYQAGKRVARKVGLL